MPSLSQQFVFPLNSGTFATTSISVSAGQLPPQGQNPDGSALFVSNMEKGDGYFGSSDGLHTVQYKVTPEFSGTLKVQASLATDPIEADWFDVDNTTVTYALPTGALLTTTTNYVNFTGNFVWVRASILRDPNLISGGVLFINYNH